MLYKAIKKHKFSAVLLILCTIFFLLGIDCRLQLTRCTISSPKISYSIRVALVTDLHSSNYGKNQAEIVNLIKKEKPDIILLGGDIFDYELSDNKTLEFLSGIKQMDHVFYVSGNHEIWSNRYPMMKLQLRDNNITVLSGDNKVIEIKGQNISISGIDDPELSVPPQIMRVCFYSLKS